MLIVLVVLMGVLEMVRVLVMGGGRVAGLVESGVAVGDAVVGAVGDADAVCVGVPVGRAHIAVHFLLDRLGLFAGAGAFRLRHGGLEEVDEVVEVGCTQRVEEFLCRRWSALQILP